MLHLIDNHSVVVTNTASLLEHFSNEADGCGRNATNQQNTAIRLRRRKKEGLNNPVNHILAKEESFPEGLPVGGVADKFGRVYPSNYDLSHEAAPPLGLSPVKICSPRYELYWR